MAGPTNDQVQTALAAAQAQRLTWSDKAALLSQAIDRALVNSSGEVEIPWTSAGGGGSNVSRLSIDAAVELLRKIEGLSTGGISANLAEFTSGSFRQVR